MNETSMLPSGAWPTCDPVRPSVPVAAGPHARLVTCFEDAVRARGGDRRDVLARAWVLPEARDIRTEVRRIIPILGDFVSFVAPAEPSRGALVRALVPLATRLGLIAPDAPPATLVLEPIRFLGALADLLVTWEGDVRVIEPRFVLWGETPTDEVGRVRGHVVVLDPLGPTGEPGLGATLTWLAGLPTVRGTSLPTAEACERVGRVPA